jgi:TonB family protein
MMKSIFLLLCLVCLHATNAQTKTNNPKPKITEVQRDNDLIINAKEEHIAVPEFDNETDSNKIYNAAGVEVQPEFPGGITKLYVFIEKKIKISDEAKAAALKGKVFVTFVVEKDGRLTDVRIIRDIGYSTKEAVLDVMKSCPNWNPAEHNGKKVRCQYSLPIIIDGTKK